MDKLVKDFNENVMRKNYKEPMSVYARLIDVQSELGELAKEYLKSSNYGTADFVLTTDFELEYGDVLYSILTLADEVCVDSKKVLNLVLEKYRKRIEDNNDMGSGR